MAKCQGSPRRLGDLEGLRGHKFKMERFSGKSMQPWRSPRILARETGLGIMVLLVYLGVSMLSRGQQGVAMAHARQLLALERGLGIFLEPYIQGAVAGTFGAWLLGEFYLLAHPLITLGFIAGLFLSSSKDYVRIRNIFIVFSLLSFLVYFLYPAAPPRLLPDSGIVDLVEGSGAVDYDEGVMKFLMGLVDPYAAMPSVHFGYSLIVGVFIFLSLSRRALGLIGLGYPVVMLLSVAATGNHFLVDCIASVFVLALGVFIVDKVKMPGLAGP